MWSNKDIILAKSEGRPMPRYHVLEGASPHVGLMGAEFIRNNFFVTGQVPTFVVENETQARILDEFLRQTYESTEPEAVGAFPSPKHDTLHKIVWFDDGGHSGAGRGNASYAPAPERVTASPRTRKRSAS
jgi:hypothetical protein